MHPDSFAPEIAAALALVEAQLAAEQADKKIPGLAAGVVYGGELIWQRGFGYADLEKQIPAGERSVYRVASITKLFTATMLMQLRDAGKLQLDDPIEKHLPAFKIKSPFPDARPPTFRQVAAHAAGLPREGGHDGWRSMNMPTVEALLALLQQGETCFPTMTEPKYSNLGIALMGHALSLIAGQPYVDYVAESILRPLGMNDSGFDVTRYGDGQLARGYYRDRDAQFRVAPHWDEQAFRPAGGMYSTVADMARFIALQFADSPGGVLSPSTVREMHAPVIVSPDFETGFGVGWGIRRVAGHKVIGHSGGLPGYTTNITVVPALKLAAIVFTNTDGEPVMIAQSVLELLIPAFKRQLAREEGEPSAEEVERWRQYTGRYAWLSADNVLVVEIIKKRLMLTTPGAAPNTFVTLAPHDGHRFRMKGGPSSGDYVTFETDAAGKVTGLMLGSYPFNRLEDGAS